MTLQHPVNKDNFGTRRVAPKLHVDANSVGGCDLEGAKTDPGAHGSLEREKPKQRIIASPGLEFGGLMLNKAFSSGNVKPIVLWVRIGGALKTETIDNVSGFCARMHVEWRMRCHIGRRPDN